MRVNFFLKNSYNTNNNKQYSLFRCGNFFATFKHHNTGKK